MAHPQQLQFVQTVSRHLSRDYYGKRILEIGSYDVNGSVRQFFDRSSYVGVDLTEGPGVDVVCEGNKVSHPDESYDLTLSCECFEHNPQWLETLLNMYRMTKPGGVVIFTCATTGRLEHGTARTTPTSSPGTQSVGWNYYRNLTARDFTKSAPIDKLFDSHMFLTNKPSYDLYFVGVKKGTQKPFNFDPASLRQQCVRDLDEIQRGIEAQYRYGKAARAISRITWLPMLVAARLPDRYFQNFAFHYVRFLESAKASLKTAFEKRPR